MLGDNGDFSVDANGTPSVELDHQLHNQELIIYSLKLQVSATWGGQIWLECRYDLVH